MRLLLVVNSFASSVTPRNTVVVHRRLSRDHDVEVVETNRRGHATRFAVDAARRGLDAVIAFGGDGTLNEVATGVAGTETALGVLPGGSTNVFARTIGLSNDPVAAADELADALGEGHITPVGLGTVNGRHFCFHTGVGFDAAVVAAVERRASLKRWFGHPLFIWSTVSTWSRGFDRARPNHSVIAVTSAPTRRSSPSRSNRSRTFRASGPACSCTTIATSAPSARSRTWTMRPKRTSWASPGRGRTKSRRRAMLQSPDR